MTFLKWGIIVTDTRRCMCRNTITLTWLLYLLLSWNAFLLIIYYFHFQLYRGTFERQFAVYNEVNDIGRHLRFHPKSYYSDIAGRFEVFGWPKHGR